MIRPQVPRQKRHKKKLLLMESHSRKQKVEWNSISKTKQGFFHSFASPHTRTKAWLFIQVDKAIRLAKENPEEAKAVAK